MKCSKCGQRMIRVNLEQWACSNPKCERYGGRDLAKPNVVETK